MLMRGFDEVFYVPHSRNTTVKLKDVRACSKLKILATSEKAGLYAAATEGGRQIFITGHSEYDADTLKNEYLRDVSQGIDPHVPENYFPGDDPARAPLVTWRSHAKLLRLPVHPLRDRDHQADRVRFRQKKRAVSKWFVKALNLRVQRRGRRPRRPVRNNLKT